MDISKKINGNILELKVSGRLDTTTAPELEGVIMENMIGDINSMVMDIEKLDYISSAGLRIFLISQKMVDKLGGTLTVKKVKQEIMPLFEMTGFTEFLKIEQEDNYGTES